MGSNEVRVLGSGFVAQPQTGKDCVLFVSIFETPCCWLEVGFFVYAHFDGVKS